MKLEIEIDFLITAEKRKLVTTKFKKELMSLIESHFSTIWRTISYYQRDD